MNCQVEILSKKVLDKRYPKGTESRMAKLTREAIENQYSIALVYQEGLHHSTHLDSDVTSLLTSTLPTKASRYILWGFTDLSDLHEDKVYVAFKEQKTFWSLKDSA